jgi:MFS family permease
MNPRRKIIKIFRGVVRQIRFVLRTDTGIFHLLRDRKLGVLAIANALDTMSTTIVVPVLPSLADQLGASPFLIGLLFTVPAVVGAVVQIPGGFLSDQWGRKPVISIGMTLSSIPVMAIAFAWSPLVLLVLRGADGFFRAFVSPATNAYIGDTYERDKRGQAFSIYHTSGMVGAAIGPVLGGVIAEIGGLGLPFLILGVGTLLGGLILFVYLPTVAVKTEDTEAAPKILDMANINSKTYLSVPIVAWLLVVFIDEFGSTALRPSIAPLLSETLGRGPAYVGVTYSALAVAMLLFLPIGGRVTDRLGRINVLLVSFVGWAVVMVGLAITTRPILPPILMFLGGILSALAVPALYALRYELAPEGREATFSGITGTAESIGEAAGPAFAGLAMGIWGVQITVILAGLSWLAALPLIGLLIPTRKDSDPTDKL